MPPVREIAAKSGEDALDIIYDYMYRLTSTTVHFSPASLLRLGWGPHMDMDVVTFDTKNIAPYFGGINRIYGSYLFCLYFELFPRFLRPDQDTKEAVDDLRSRIVRIFRWPEIVTFEEMNLPTPEVNKLVAAVLLVRYSQTMDNGFISGARETRNKLIGTSGKLDADEER